MSRVRRLRRAPLLMAPLVLGAFLVFATQPSPAQTGPTRAWMLEDAPQEPTGFGFDVGQSETDPGPGTVEALTNDGGDALGGPWGPGDRTEASPVEVIGGREPGADGGFGWAGSVEAGSVTLSAPPLATPGKPLRVTWAGGGGAADFVTLVQADAPDDRTGPKARATADGPAELTPPPLPGDYEVRYIDGATGSVLARSAVIVAAAEVTVVAPPQATPGSSLPVNLVDPLHPKDYLTVVAADAPPETVGEKTEVGNGGPHVLTVPAEPGKYEIRYILHLGPRVFGWAPLEVVAPGGGGGGDAEPTPELVLNAPENGLIGAAVAVSWTGPQPDPATLILVPAYLALDVPQDLEDDSVLARHPASPEGTIAVTLPVAPGAYDLRLVDPADGRVLAVAPITVTWAEVTLTAPETVPAGGSVAVSWSPTVTPADRILLVAKGTRSDADADAAAALADGQKATTGDASEATLVAPAEPGAYELRYVLTGPGDTSEVLARAPLTVTAPPAPEPEPVPEPPVEQPPGVSLDLPAEAAPNDRVEVGWRGPNQARDRIALARPAQPDVSWLWSVLTADGAPAILRMPDEPGTYEVRYLDVTNRAVLARRSIAVVSQPEPAPAPAPAEAEAAPAPERSEAEALLSKLNGIAPDGSCACTCETFATLTQTLERHTQAGIGLLRRDPAASGSLRAAITGAQSRAGACIRRCQAAFLGCG